jgi:hypothetical protein
MQLQLQSNLQPVRKYPFGQFSRIHLPVARGKQHGTFIRQFPFKDPGVLISMTTVTRGSTDDMSMAPLVSRETSKSASQSASSNLWQFGWARGSPPVTQISRVWYPEISPTIGSIPHHSPPSNAYAVSQY